MLNHEEYQRVEASKTVQSNVRQQPIRAVLMSFDMKDRQVQTFWLLGMASVLSFAFWLRLISFFCKIPTLPNLRKSSYSTEDFTKVLSTDVWFALMLMASLDAFATVATFGRTVSNRFHYAVSLRMAFLSWAISYGLLLWNKRRCPFLSQHPIRYIAIWLVLYMLFGYALDKFEKPMSIRSSYPRRTLWQYSETLSLFDVSWLRALLYGITIGGTGLTMTILLPAAWSEFVPLALSIFEILKAVFLSAVKAGRTPRYLVLTLPLLQATYCWNWGLVPLAAGSRLTMPLWLFLTIMVSGRCLLDVHLCTVFRHRPDLKWIRREVLISSPKVLGACVGILFLEKLGLNLVTYVKPVSVLLGFTVTGAGVMAPAAYVIAFDRNKTTRS